MRAHLWTAINDLMDAADYAKDALDNYTDLEDGEHGAQEPNAALIAFNALSEALIVLQKQMEQELPK